MFSAKLQNFPLKHLLDVNVLRISVKVEAQRPHYNFWVNLSFKWIVLTYIPWLAILDFDTDTFAVRQKIYCF